MHGHVACRINHGLGLDDQRLTVELARLWCVSCDAILADCRELCSDVHILRSRDLHRLVSRGRESVGKRRVRVGQWRDVDRSVAVVDGDEGAQCPGHIAGRIHRRCGIDRQRLAIEQA